MYKRHNVWDEDKWDIHHKSDTKYAGGSAGYAGHAHGDNPSEYHKGENYNSGNPGEKLKDDYRSAHKKDDDKDKEKEKDTITDRLEEEEKKEKRKHEDDDAFQSIKKDFNPAMHLPEEAKKDEKHHKTIEEAISKAIKEEKKVIFMD